MTGRSSGGWQEPSEREVEAEVKWYNPTKGFGFVQLSDGSPDAFLHVSVVEQLGRQDLPDGTRIICDLAEGRKGRQVAFIHRIEELGAGSPRGRDGGFGGGGGYRDDRGGGYRDHGGGYRDDRGGGGGFRDDRGGGYRDGGGGGGYRGGGGGGGYRDDRGGGGFGGPPGGGEQPGTPVDGTVKFFDQGKGYGFIAPDDGGKDVFVSARTLGRVGLTALDTDQRVRMVVRMGQKGPMADSVEPI
ncbi:MAG: cold-shock protein [Pseudomonadota bacterium]